MAQLVAILSTGKGTWQEVAALINKPEFDEIFILTNSFGKDKFTNLPDKKIEVFAFDFDKDILLLAKDFYSALKSYIKFGDIAVNMSSGSGKEHMALFSALMKLGAGIRLISIKNTEVVEVSPHVDSETGRII
ncbi:MAG: hypothetical protein ACMXX5_02320 [Candidatus Woesearchaeota archaeon]